MSLDIQNVWPIENPVTIRAAAALPAAGAFDANPTEIAVAGVEWITFYFAYTRGGAAGGFDWELEVSPYAADLVGVEDWFNGSIYSAGAVAAGADTTSLVQREEQSYTATGAAVETFVVGPVRLAGTVERLRVPCQESGNVGAPGELHVVAVLR